MNLPVIGLVIALALAGWQTYRLSEADSRYFKQSAAWAKEREALATETKDAIESRNTAERAKSASNLENANDQAQRAAEAVRLRAAAADAGGRMRDAIEALNRRAVPQDPAAAGFADEAAVARELVGECSERREQVAAAAHELRDQVVGLQRYVSEVCLAHQD